MSMKRRDIMILMGFGALSLVDCRGADASAGPLIEFPRLWEKLRSEADSRVIEAKPGNSIRFEPGNGVYSPELVGSMVERPQTKSLPIASDGLLVFAVDVPRDTYATGSLELTPHSDLRPGLRAMVHCDDRLIAAPMVTAPTWGATDVTTAAPMVQGNEPPAQIPIGRFLLPHGRRYLTVGGPGFRPGGEFRALTLTIRQEPAETPLYTFAFLSDTHLRETGRPEWMNRKMGEAVPGAFRATLHQLASEGIKFLQHGGDMTEGATRDEFQRFASLLADQPLPVYGCIGNHDAYHPTSRPDALELLGKYFPGGTLDYTYNHKPLRFITLDENLSNPDHAEAKQEWLRKTLAADPKTPTIVVWHYAFLNRGSASQCGFRVPDWSQFSKEHLLSLLDGAPQVFATLNGHDHWDEVNSRGRVQHIQNAAFVEWPNTYRVFRVYSDRIEWETRQVANRGFVRESLIPQKALTWMISTRDQDLMGEARFAPPARS